MARKIAAESFCGTCQLPLWMCVHGRAVSRARIDGAETVALSADWHEAAEQVADLRDDEDWGPLVIAEYGGDCVVCARPWEPGDTIRRSRDEGRYGHAECAG